MEMIRYRGYSVRSIPLDRNMEHAAGPSPPVEQGVQLEQDLEEIIDIHEVDDEEEEDEDQNLIEPVRLTPPNPVPCQLDKFHRYLKIGFFLASIEVLSDRSDGNIEEIREHAKNKFEELVKSTGEMLEPEIPVKEPCGTSKIKRDLKRMSKHLKFFNELFIKFVSEFDGSPVRLNKLRRATGFIKGILVLENISVFNIPQTSTPGNYAKDLDIFKVNALLFMQYLKFLENQ
ncbi:NR LBD domain-containing protein [Caenorhabditis elegans]|nr:NR LBD domain-containing protein [Caenorhabditis elegans]CBZ01815.1 NR LBD domain-containing protein [Caenorhabditis elegans]|eukprot:NP_001257137.1 Uncharacterized protein CELE_C34F6.5 [Caenorhabditis elegans]